MKKFKTIPTLGQELGVSAQIKAGYVYYLCLCPRSQVWEGATLESLSSPRNTILLHNLRLGTILDPNLNYLLHS